MTIDCRWMNDNLEAYCCDRLSPEDGRLAQTHLGNCAACTSELESIEAIDPLVKGLFRYRLSVASAPRTRRRLAPAVAAACALAVLALVAVLQFRPDAPPPIQSSSIEAPPPAAIESVVPKSVEPSDVIRAKPDAAAAPAPAPSPLSSPNTGNPSEAFAVIDQAGYIRRLSDYRGFVLLFGLWSKDQPASAANLDQLYRAFGDNTKFRLLGVADSRQNGPSGVTFPVVYNQESQLLGALPGEFVVIDAAGVERLRGSLLTDPAGLIRSVRTILQPQ